MKTISARPSRNKPLILSPRDEEMLRSIYHYRYMTAEDMAYLLFSPTSLTYVRQRLSRLAGGEDLHPNSYLCRFPLPTVGAGNQRKIFTLGIKGRNYLQREAGLPVDWYFRPSHYRDVGFSHLRHALLMTRVVGAAQYWSRKQSHYTLTRTRLSYDLARTSTKVIPDAWLSFEDTQGKKYPVLLEMDRGMEFQAKFKRHVKARIAFVESDEYRKTFGTRAVMIAYATTGQTPDYRETRRATMTTWTKDVLEELGKEKWAGIFRFTSLVLDEIYDLALFEKPVWYRPDGGSPVPLLTP